jgi:hypothetical protein
MVFHLYMTTAKHAIEVLRVKTVYFLSPKERYSGIPFKIAFILLQLTDVTVTGVANSIGLNEVNPLMRELLNYPLQLLIVKMYIPLLIAWLFPGKWLIPAIIFLIIIVGFDGTQLAAYAHR